MKINIPKNAKLIIDRLTANGEKAYAVGGCIRDALRGVEPHDWDITTSAFDDKIEALFCDDFKVVKTGIKYGTVTLIKDGEFYETTTFRMDGEYHDMRRPDSVIFVDNVVDDLRRRDFTMNAIAYNDIDGLIDPFDGKKDIDEKIIRCVGDPDKRFNEDALRILRGIRFSSTLGFEIEKDTLRSMIENRHLLTNVSKERINIELTKFLMGDNVRDTLKKCEEVIFTIIPELKKEKGLGQFTKFHCYDVWDHTIVSVASADKDPKIRLTMLLHDIGKPDTNRVDENGISHFKGHPEAGAKIAKAVLEGLRFDKKTINDVTTLTRYHDVDIFRYSSDINTYHVRKLVSIVGKDLFATLLRVKRADDLAKAPGYIGSSLEKVDKVESIYLKILEDRDALEVADLDIKGDDLIKLGYKGKDISDTLNMILDKVMRDEVKNDKASILTYLSL